MYFGMQKNAMQRQFAECSGLARENVSLAE
jgi:hypothetical protein